SAGVAERRRARGHRRAAGPDPPLRPRSRPQGAPVAARTDRGDLERARRLGFAPVPVFVAFIRGINVGGRGKVAMPALRRGLEAAGLEDVVTYIQSGNAVFRGKGNATSVATQVEHVLADELDVPAKVLIRAPAQLAAIESANPFPDAERSKLHVVFLS